MIGLSQKVAAVATGSLVTLVAVGTPAEAITFFSFEVELTDVFGGAEPAVGDTFTGTFSFDENFGFFPVPGIESFEILSFDFDFLGTSFSTDSTTIAFGPFPTVDFDSEGNILGLFFFADSFLSGTLIDFVPEDIAVGLGEPEFLFRTADGVVGGGDVAYAPIPEPATVVGLIALGAGSLFVRKRQA